MMWVQVAGCVAAAALVLGFIGVARALWESDADRALGYPIGSPERRELERKENPPNAMVQS